MKKGIFLLLITAFTTTILAQEYKDWMTSTDVKIVDIIAAAEAYLADYPSEKERKIFERWRYNAVRLQTDEGYLPKQEDIVNALEKFIQDKEMAVQQEASSANWVELGPTNWNNTSGYNPGVGRITSFAVDPVNSSTLIIGANSGGVWKTTDLGATWTQLTDNFTNMLVYSLAIDPNASSTYFWGSTSGRIYQSTDAGITWTQAASLSGGGTVNKIIIDPTNSMKMYASVQNKGIHYSTDGGASWTEPTAEPSGYDIEFKPGDANTVYLAGNRFHRSTDGGSTFTEISGFNTNRPKMIGISPDDPSIVYVVEANGGAFGYFYKSTDSGASFTKLNHTLNYFGYEQNGSDAGAGQAPRDMGIAVSPSDADEVHIAGINTWRSFDGGTTFSPTSRWWYNGFGSYCHADVDDIEFMGSTLVAVTDGGIYFAQNSAASTSPTFYQDQSTGLGIHQFYKIGVSQTATPVVAGGSQDNGNSVLSNGTWKHWMGADGMEAMVDKTNTNILYGCIQYGGLYKSTDGGLTRNSLPSPTGNNGNWVTPLEQDPEAVDVIYLGLRKVHRSLDGGNSWTDISQDFGGNLNHLKVAPSNNNIIYAARGGNLYKTTVGTGTWSQLTGFSGNINSIAIHPTDPNRVALATSGSGKVFISTNGGTNWVSKNTGLPGFSALCVAWHNSADNTLYLGMDYGIYYTDDNQSSWNIYANQLPNVRINELEINLMEGKIYAATWGRGVWKSDLIAPTALPIELGDFRATLNEKEEVVDLSWFTLSELNNDYFMVQKSTDGVNWKDLERVASKGNSIERVDYDLVDENPAAGLNYYRLIDVDLTGKKEYSKVVSVNLAGLDLLSIYPNPSRGQFTLYAEAVEENEVEIRVYDAAGQLIQSTIKWAEKGSNQLPLDLIATPGVYFLTLSIDGMPVYQGKRLVVQE